MTLPVGQAMGRLKKVLFQSLDVGRWFVPGFCARLACLGEGGGSSALHLSHLIHSIRRPHAQPALQPDGRDDLNLLQMKSAWLHERFRNVQFPRVAPH